MLVYQRVAGIRFQVFVGPFVAPDISRQKEWFGPAMSRIAPKELLFSTWNKDPIADHLSDYIYLYIYI